jgi:hypothetical protein
MSARSQEAVIEKGLISSPSFDFDQQRSPFDY